MAAQKYAANQSSRLSHQFLYGGIGPLLQAVIAQIGEHALVGTRLQWPALNGQEKSIQS
jgi:hypothetical protein